MIKRIELVNFMSHRHTVIEPADGLTVLVGPNNCGKSAVISALQILCYNDSSTYVTMHGEKECSITVETEDGHVIKWARNRKSTRYEIDGKLYDRLGRGGVPEALHQILRLPKVKTEQSAEEFDIHFGIQKQPTFLLNESSRAAAGFFAASSDAGRLIEMQKLHRQKTRDATRDLAKLELEQKKIGDEIDSLRPVRRINNEFAKLDELVTVIEKQQQAVKEIDSISKQIAKTERRKTRILAKSGRLEKLQKPPNLNEVADLRSILAKVDSQIQLLKKMSAYNWAFDEFVNPPKLNDTAGLTRCIRELNDTQRTIQKLQLRKGLLEPVAELNHDDSKIDRLREVLNKVVQQTQSVERLYRRSEAIDNEIKQVENGLNDFIQSNPRCPTCGQKIKDNILAMIKTKDD